VFLPQPGIHAGQAGATSTSGSRGSVGSSPASSPVEDSGLSKGSISQLQEFVQGAKLFPMPPNCPVLQWDYDTRMVGTTLEFRAVCSFLLDGVAHHTVGIWRPSKKLAQRDAAERTLGLFVSRWASLITLDELAGTRDQDPLPEARSEVELLEKFCQRLSWDCPAAVSWSHRWEDGLCQAFAEVRLLDVPHTFPSKSHSTQEEAYEDAARRVLWYLQCPGYEEKFEPDTSYVKAVAQDIPEPSACWNKDDNLQEGEKSLAEKQSFILRVQDRLQQAFGQLESGKPVWYWSFERDLKDKGWPPLFRANVTVPLVNRSFLGPWERGQCQAQIQACIVQGDNCTNLAISRRRVPSNQWINEQYTASPWLSADVRQIRNMKPELPTVKVVIVANIIDPTGFDTLAHATDRTLFSRLLFITRKKLNHVTIARLLLQDLMAEDEELHDETVILNYAHRADAGALAEGGGDQVRQVLAAVVARQQAHEEAEGQSIAETTDGGEASAAMPSEIMMDPSRWIPSLGAEQWSNGEVKEALSGGCHAVHNSTQTEEEDLASDKLDAKNNSEARRKPTTTKADSGENCTTGVDGTPRDNLVRGTQLVHGQSPS
ncbi:unnamed protein product, partial [Symbiodinium microadriaticum]